MLSVIYIAFMAVAGRAHGAGWKHGRIISLVILGLSMALASYDFNGDEVISFLGGVLSACVFSMGHGRFYNMQGANLDDPKVELIEEFVQLFYKGDITKPLYSWYCMGVKGLGIGLICAPAGLLLALAWPLCYWISFKRTNDSALAEYLTGACVGSIVVWMMV